MAALHPSDAADVADIVAQAREPLELLAGGSKRAIGKPVTAAPLDLTRLTGIVSYEPAELVLTARPATPLALVAETLAASGQRLAFEPPDFGPLLDGATSEVASSDAGAGAGAGASGGRASTSAASTAVRRPSSATLGGTLSVNFGGSRRIVAGAPRDHFLGFHAVAGTGERFKAGGRVVKNVTGYDLPKLLAGSFGTLAVLTEVTIRVAPAPETECTLSIPCSDPRRAVALCSTALGSSCEVSSAAYAPRRGVLLRLEGRAASVAARAAQLVTELGGAEAERVEGDSSRSAWRALAGASALAQWPVVWRVSVAPSEAPRVLERLHPEDYLLDWGGGLITAAFREVDAERVRSAVAGGHATLLKAPSGARRSTPVFQPLPAAVAALAQRVKRAFDPDGKLNPGRMD